VFYVKANIHFSSYLAWFILEREIFRITFAGKIKSLILYSIAFFSLSLSLSLENIAAYEKMWKNFVQPNRSYKTTFCMHIACWIPKATNTHSEYVKLIAFPLQQWLKERACMLRYMYIACLVEWHRRLWIQYWLWREGHRILCISWSLHVLFFRIKRTLVFEVANSTWNIKMWDTNCEALSDMHIFYKWLLQHLALSLLMTP